MSLRQSRTRARRGLAVAAALVWAVPGLAEACPACLSSAFGDRSYSWPYIGLILLPLVVSGVVLGVVIWYAGWRPRHLAARVLHRLRAASGNRSPRTHTETT